ncbi:MAG: phosphotransferase [Proteobacteria bacterium]|nr:phosphotransferase [Pseudomonadota bacterium]
MLEAAVLKPDPRLRGMGIALGRAEMQALLSQRILPRLKPGWQLVEAQVETMTYVPTKECVALYRLSLSKPPESIVQRAVISFADERALLAAYRRYESSERARVLVLNEPCCMVEFYPDDWNLPGLARTARPEDLAIGLARLGLRAASSPYGRPSAQLLRYRPHQRSVLLLTVPELDSRPKEQWVAKLYPAAGGADRVFELLERLAEPAQKLGLRVPRAIGQLADWGLVLMQRLPGESMKSYLETEDRHRARAECLRAVETLIKLHRLPVAEGSAVLCLRDELRRLQERAASVEVVAPELADQVQALLSKLERPARTVGPGQLSFVHGEYKPSQLLLSGPAPLAVLDMDDAGLGDPALDVGNFMAELHRAAVRSKRNELRELATVFLHEYETRRPESGLAFRARIMRCMALLRMAIRSFQRNPSSFRSRGSACRVGQLLAEAAGCIQELRL